MSREIFYRAYPNPLNKEPLWYSELPVVKRTRCGVWLDEYGKKRFVNTTCRKQYAYATKEEARKGYLARTKRYIEILKHRLACAENDLASVEGFVPPPMGLLEFKL